MFKYKTSVNFYKNPKKLLRNSNKNYKHNIHTKNRKSGIENNFNDEEKTNNKNNKLKNKKYYHARNNISMFNLHYNNTDNDIKSNNELIYLNMDSNPYIENKRTYKIDEENDTEEDMDNDTDKTNNLFKNILNMINSSNKVKNGKEESKNNKYDYPNFKSEKNIKKDYYDKVNINYINGQNKGSQNKDINRDNKNKIKNNSKRRRCKSSLYKNSRKGTLYARTMYNFYNRKILDSIEKYDRKSLSKNIDYMTNTHNSNLNQNYTTKNLHSPKKIDDDVIIIKSRINKSSKKKRRNINNIKSNLINSFQNINDTFSSLQSSKKTYNISDIIQRRILSNKNYKNNNNNKKKKEQDNYNEDINDIENRENIINRSFLEIDYLCHNNSNIKKFDNNIAETVKNKLKSKLISLTDDLKEEDDEKKLKFYIGPIDLSLISIKGNLKESIEDLKYKIYENDLEYIDNYSENNNNQIKFIKNGVIYIAEVVKIRSNLLYYLITKQNKE